MVFGGFPSGYRIGRYYASARRGSTDAFRNDADVQHGKNIIHGLDMSGTMRSSPGVLSSSFMSRSESQIAQPL